MTKDEFIKRFVEKMTEKHVDFFNTAADASWLEYLCKPDDRTPEQWAEDEIDSWN